jgi:hypothetical protein
MVRHMLLLVASGMIVGQIAVRAGLEQESAQQSDETTVVGCLQAGANTGEFVLVNDEKVTYQVQPGEGVEIAPHVDHRVELTGTIEKTESSMIFKAKALKMVSASCSP